MTQFNNSHGALGDRARKIDQGILVIRFEMPFNVWCTGCGHLIGKGVRFNAEKKQIGTYHSTRIWSFCMRAPCCQQKIEIHTDPKNAEYRIVTGLRRKRESFNAEDAGTVELASAAERESRRDPLSSLDRDLEDRTRAAEANRAVATLQRESTARYRCVLLGRFGRAKWRERLERCTRPCLWVSCAHVQPPFIAALNLLGQKCCVCARLTLGPTLQNAGTTTT